MHAYSPERRTALVLCGTGAHGAYHAGVLRAIEEAGVKIDVVAGQGIGAAAAALSAIDGAAKLWEDGGVWRSQRVAGFYRPKRAIRLAWWLAFVVAVLAAIPLLLLAAGVSRPNLARVALAVPVAAAVAFMLMARRAPSKRRATGRWWWRLTGAPLDGAGARDQVVGAAWQLIRGAVQAAHPSRALFGRRYSEVLSENLSQPGFRELMVMATDVDTKRDVVAAMLREPFRHAFMASQPGRERKAEAIDLAGTGRDLAFEIIAGAMTPPVGCDLHPITFAPDSFWRGETHRFCDRPGLIERLLSELAAAGVTQAIVVNAASPVSAPHRLASPRFDTRGRLGEFLAAAECAAVQQALDASGARFEALYLICPAHNPVGPFDFAGAYDDASDRRHSLFELMERAYEDAYRQFIEPAVGASGEQLARPAGADGLANRTDIESA